MGANGSNQNNPPFVEPVWSPVSNKIAFRWSNVIHVMPLSDLVGRKGLERRTPLTYEPLRRWSLGHQSRIPRPSRTFGCKVPLAPQSGPYGGFKAFRNKPEGLRVRIYDSRKVCLRRLWKGLERKQLPRDRGPRFLCRIEYEIRE
jgi:hypothetical protein